MRRDILSYLAASAVLLSAFSLSGCQSRQEEAQNTPIEEVTNENSEEKTYLSATEYMNNKAFGDAISAFSSIRDYKDSRSLLGLCYAKYDGYYYDEETGITFRIQNYENNSIVEISSISDSGERCTIKETIVFDGDSCEFEFNDSENNKGNGLVTLENKKIDLTIETTEKSSDLRIPDTIVSFDLDSKTDQPIRKALTLDILKDILRNKYSIGDLKRQGYELSYDGSLNKWSTIEGFYGFENADIAVVAYPYYVDETAKWEEENPDYYLTGESQSPPCWRAETGDECIAYYVVGPAKLIAPEKIGELSVPYREGDLLFYPNGIYAYMDIFGFRYDNYEICNEEIEADTMIIFADLSQVGNIYFTQTIEHFVSDKAEIEFCKEYSEHRAVMDILSDESDCYIVQATAANDEKKKAKYRVFKDDYRVEKVDGASNESTADTSKPEPGKYEVRMMGKVNPYGTVSDTCLEYREISDDRIVFEGTFYRASEKDTSFIDRNGDYFNDVRFEIKIADNAEFYGWNGEREEKEFFPKDEFLEMLKDVNIDLIFEINEDGEGYSFGLVP